MPERSAPGARRDWPRVVRAAHYFSDGWPLDSLTVMRMPGLRSELKQLRSDGFNTIILVVPWRGFQNSQSPVSYDDFYQRQLQLVLAEAERARLQVLLRVAFAHQVLRGPAVGSIRAAQGVLTDASMEAAWLDYHERLSAIVRANSCCIGAFVSWEEFWQTFTHWQRLPPGERRQFARSSGFLDYLESKSVNGMDAVPELQGPGHEHFHGFMNHRIRSLFERARERFPLLGIEYRADRDPLVTAHGTQWLENDPFSDWEPARFSYWAPFMGAQNEGEAIPALEALESLHTMLRKSSDEGRRTGQVLEQFNFIDDTPKYAGVHAQIADGEMARFLRGAVPLLRRYTSGYGLWAPRDYRCNMLFNTAFLDRGRAWELSAGEFLTCGGALLPAAAMLTQRIEPRIAWVPKAHPFSEVRLRLQYCGKQRPQLRAQLNEGGWRELTCSEPGVAEATLPVDFDTIVDGGLRFELANDGGSVELQRVHLYDQVYSAGVRDVDGSPGRFLRDVRTFNRRLRFSLTS